MSRKRLLSTVLALFLLLSVSVPVSAAGLSNFKKHEQYTNFLDVAPDAWYAESVKTVCEYGIMNGRSPAEFAPNGNVSFAEALAIICRLHYIYNGGDGLFQATDPWYLVYLYYANEFDILSFDTFPPEDFMRGYISREVFTHMLALALPDDATYDINHIGFGLLPGISVSRPYAKDIYRFFNAGILTGSDSSGTFLEEDSISRAEVSSILARIVDTNLRKTGAVTPQGIAAWAQTSLIDKSGNLSAPAGSVFDVDVYVDSSTKNNCITWSSALLKPNSAYISKIFHDENKPANCWTATVVAAKADTSIIYFTDAAGNSIEWDIDILERRNGASQETLPSADTSTYKKTSDQIETEKFWAELERRIAESEKGNSTSPVPPDPQIENSIRCNYIINTNTGKFHYPWCSSVGKMNESNKWYYTGTHDEVVNMGYDPCQRCCP